MDKVLIIGYIISTIFLWFWAIFDISVRSFKKLHINIIWLLVVFFLPIIGSILYFQLRNKIILKEKRLFKPKFKIVE
ncbi:PLDc N-terminal domain-containing protein [Fulvivirga maritima]|uniref:PLDc N-terminal domain-containing protein n=1 Tax=Fulvivirga maritima TaxID=2904247 RepID=UPI001F3E27B2|nr:PLDc N-terminal domain-containing protein [Fulvivirga maritima]UII28305.1 PLDc N-terminal domain-containing protein [Fulvivirga maritima]